MGRPFHELVENYTFAQINLFIIAKADLARRSEKRAGRRPKKQEKEKVKPHKPFKEMTGDEYMQWVNSNSGGRF